MNPETPEQLYVAHVASQRAADLMRRFPNASPRLLYAKAIAEVSKAPARKVTQ
jgi:hypothetical protein